MANKLVEKFKEIVFEDEVKVPECVNRVQKEAFICKRLKMSRNQLYETCLSTGIDTIYDELMRKGGRK